MDSLGPEPPDSARRQYHQLCVRKVVGQSFPGCEIPVANLDDPLVRNNADDNDRISPDEAAAVDADHRKLDDQIRLSSYAYLDLGWLSWTESDVYLHRRHWRRR